MDKAIQVRESILISNKVSQDYRQKKHLIKLQSFENPNQFTTSDGRVIDFVKLKYAKRGFYLDLIENTSNKKMIYSPEENKYDIDNVYNKQQQYKSSKDMRYEQAMRRVKVIQAKKAPDDPKNAETIHTYTIYKDFLNGVTDEIPQASNVKSQRDRDLSQDDANKSSVIPKTVTQSQIIKPSTKDSAKPLPQATDKKNQDTLKTTGLKDQTKQQDSPTNKTSLTNKTPVTYPVDVNKTMPLNPTSELQNPQKKPVDTSPTQANKLQNPQTSTKLALDTGLVKPIQSDSKPVGNKDLVTKPQQTSAIDTIKDDFPQEKQPVPKLSGQTASPANILNQPPNQLPNQTTNQAFNNLDNQPKKDSNPQLDKLSQLAKPMIGNQANAPVTKPASKPTTIAQIADNLYNDGKNDVADDF